MVYKSEEVEGCEGLKGKDYLDCTDYMRQDLLGGRKASRTKRSNKKSSKRSTKRS